jgi:intein/homing endonuclease
MLSSFMSWAQEGNTKAEYDAIQLAFENDKRKVIEANMILEESETEAFWEIYDRYEAERSAVAEDRITMISKFKANGQALGESELRLLLNRSTLSRIEVEVLRKQYYDEFAELLGFYNALYFVLLDRYIDAKVNTVVLEKLSN